MVTTKTGVFPDFTIARDQITFEVGSITIVVTIDYEKNEVRWPDQTHPFEMDEDSQFITTFWEIYERRRAALDTERDEEGHEEFLRANGRLASCLSCHENIDTDDFDSYVYGTMSCYFGCPSGYAHNRLECYEYGSIICRCRDCR
jgi:hypothetical protein